MDILVKNSDLILSGVEDFKLDHIFECGQCFRFNKIDENTYLGTAFSRTLKISQNNSEVTLHETSEQDFHDIWYDFFDLSRDYGKIKSEISSDGAIRDAVAMGGGIRILNQDLWETIVSFIISASNNIPRIKGIIERLCENFGNKISYMGKDYYSFPTPETLATLCKEDLAVIRAGFRDKYIIDAARKVKSGEVSLDALREMNTQDAKKTLMTINGIGNKVANCILLFGLHKTDAFPVDVWIKRIMEYCYFDGEQSLDTISRFAEDKFGQLGGYAQQYLFYWARENKIGVQED